MASSMPIPLVLATLNMSAADNLVTPSVTISSGSSAGSIGDDEALPLLVIASAAATAIAPSGSICDAPLLPHLFRWKKEREEEFHLQPRRPLHPCQT